jgi:FixJ family two-component response regulator
MGRATAAVLTRSERSELESLAHRRRTAQGLAQRARIVLAAADGLENKAIAQRLGACENTVGGTVTLPCEERERSRPHGFSSRRDGLAPRGHRRGA